MPDWAAQAAPYVHVANYVATVDPTITTALNPAVVAQVTSAVAAYNASPLDQRAAGNNPNGSVKTARPTRAGRLVSPDLLPGGGGGCYAYTSSNWFGPSLYMDHCTTQWIEGEFAAGITIATIASGLCTIVTGGVCGPAAVGYWVVIAGALGGILWAMANADHGNGVWVNFTETWIPYSITTG